MEAHGPRAPNTSDVTLFSFGHAVTAMTTALCQAEHGMPAFPEIDTITRWSNEYNRLAAGG